MNLIKKLKVGYLTGGLALLALSAGSIYDLSQTSSKQSKESEPDYSMKSIDHLSYQQFSLRDFVNSANYLISGTLGLTFLLIGAGLDSKGRSN